MNPGRELDALIAEKVLGHELGRFGHGDAIEIITYGPHFIPIPRYSTSIEAAWEVVEKLDLFGCKDLPGYGPIWYVLGKNTAGWVIADTRDMGWSVEGDTAPHAICVAALKAIGHPF